MWEAGGWWHSCINYKYPWGKPHESIALTRFPPRPSDQQAGWYKYYCSRKDNLQNRVAMVGHLSPTRSSNVFWDLFCSLTSWKQVRGDQGIVWYLSWTKMILCCWSSTKEAHLQIRVSSYPRQWWEKIQIVMKKCYVSKWPWKKFLYPLIQSYSKDCALCMSKGQELGTLAKNLSCCKPK